MPSTSYDSTRTFLRTALQASTAAAENIDRPFICSSGRISCGDDDDDDGGGGDDDDDDDDACDARGVCDDGDGDGGNGGT